MNKYFKPHHTLEQRLKQVRLVELFMNVGQVIFLALAVFNYYKPDVFLGWRELSYFFGGIAIFQFFLVKFWMAPMLRKKAHENLPDS